MYSIVHMRILGLWALFHVLCVANAARSTYDYYCTGRCETDSVVNSSPGVVLMGGGTDVNEAFVWQIGKAAGGDFLVLRASGDEAYNEYIYALSLASDGTTLNTVSTIVFNSARAAEDDFVLDKIARAEAIFFAGGDQSDYIDYWMGTSVQTLIQSKVANVSVGGTSAGCAVLGNFIYTGEKGSNPYNREMTFAPYFLQLPFLGTVITDTHFVTRDRMGRLLAFVARELVDQNQETVRGVGINEQTALLLDTTTGIATTVGTGSAYICTNTQQPLVCTAGDPLTFLDVECSRLVAINSDVYNFKTWRGGEDYELNVLDGTVVGSQYGPLPDK